LGLSLSFEDEELNNDMKNVLKNFENIKTNKKDSTKYLLMTHYLDPMIQMVLYNLEKKNNL
jgi:hypothetical protein